MPTPEETLSPSHHELMTIATAVATGLGTAIDSHTGKMGTPYLVSLGQIAQNFYEKFCAYKEEQHADLQALIEKICCSKPEIQAIADALAAQAQNINNTEEIVNNFLKESLEAHKAYEDRLTFPEKEFYPFLNMPNEATVLEASGGCFTYILPEGTILQTCDHCDEFQAVFPFGRIEKIVVSDDLSVKIPEDGPHIPSRILNIDPDYCKRKGGLFHAAEFPGESKISFTKKEEGYPEGERVLQIEFNGIKVTYYRHLEKVLVSKDSGFINLTYSPKSTDSFGLSGKTIRTFQDGELIKHQGEFINLVTVFPDMSYLFDLRKQWGTHLVLWTCGNAKESQAFAHLKGLPLPPTLPCIQDPISPNKQMGPCESNSGPNPFKGGCNEE